MILSFPSENNTECVTFAPEIANLTLIMHISEKQRALAKNLGTGMPIKHAMIEAGYSEHTANNGMAKVSGRALRLLAKEGHKLIDVGKSLSLKDQEHLVIGRLAVNVARGKDAGAQSAKILGSRRELNLFQADQVSGVIVVVPPSKAAKDLLDSDE